MEPTIELDVNDVIEDVAVAEPTTESESSTDEPREAVEDADLGDEPTETDDQGDDSAEVEETPVVEYQAAEERKAKLQTEIRDLVAQKSNLRAEIERVNSQHYRAQTSEELMAEGVDPAMARIDAMEQRAQLAEYNSAIADLNSTLDVESLQVIADMPIFDEYSKEYDKSFADRVSQEYMRVANIQRDPNTGHVIEAAVTPYQFYKAFADVRSQSVATGATKGQRAAEKMLASADTASSSAPKQPQEDNFLKGFLGDKYSR